MVVGTSHRPCVFANEGMLRGYAPKVWTDLPTYHDPSRNGSAWTSMARGLLNTVKRQLNLPKPETWKDRNRFTAESSCPSGVFRHRLSGRRGLAADVGRCRRGIHGLHDNVAHYTHSGSKPCREAGAGEFPIGISFEYRAVTTKKGGAPIDIIFPKEGLGWDLEASGIMKATKKVDAARKLMDWLATPDAMALFAKNFAVLAMPGIAKPLDFIPADYEQRLVKNDFAWSAKNRDKILAEWTKRYDGKSEPK
jgi:iron(III) transport system substrate-binding protein